MYERLVPCLFVLLFSLSWQNLIKKTIQETSKLCQIYNKIFECRDLEVVHEAELTSKKNSGTRLFHEISFVKAHLDQLQKEWDWILQENVGLSDFPSPKLKSPGKSRLKPMNDIIFGKNKDFKSVLFQGYDRCFEKWVYEKAPIHCKIFNSIPTTYKVELLCGENHLELSFSKCLANIIIPIHTNMSLFLHPHKTSSSELLADAGAQSVDCGSEGCYKESSITPKSELLADAGAQSVDCGSIGYCKTEFACWDLLNGKNLEMDYAESEEDEDLNVRFFHSNPAKRNPIKIIDSLISEFSIPKKIPKRICLEKNNIYVVRGKSAFITEKSKFLLVSIMDTTHNDGMALNFLEYIRIMTSKLDTY